MTTQTLQITQRVIFRVWTRADARGDVIAFFPDQEANPGMVGAYEHIGQHGEADYYGLLKVTRPATPEEYAPLLKELKNVGYVLRVVRRLGRAS